VFPYNITAKVLVVGGGGSGGDRHAGGGGVGAAVFIQSQSFVAGARYDITVGVGAAIQSDTAYSGTCPSGLKGGDSSVVNNGSSVILALGGGGGNRVTVITLLVHPAVVQVVVQLQTEPIPRERSGCVPTDLSAGCRVGRGGKNVFWKEEFSALESST
jgi:hypothetical protein